MNREKSFLNIAVLIYVHVLLHPFQTGSLGTMPNLRYLRMQLNSNLADLSLASLLKENEALEHLHIHLTADLVHTGGIGVRDAKGAILRHQLQEELTPRLKEITLEGPEIDNLHPAAFKVCSVTWVDLQRFYKLSLFVST